MSAHEDVSGNDIAAALEPDMRVQPVIDHDVIGRLAPEALAQLQATIEKEVVVDAVI